MSKETVGDQIRWVPANEFIEDQTTKMAKEFKTSKPRPRNRAMGFTGSDYPKRGHRSHDK